MHKIHKVFKTFAHVNRKSCWLSPMHLCMGMKFVYGKILMWTKLNDTIEYMPFSLMKNTVSGAHGKMYDLSHNPFILEPVTIFPTKTYELNVNNC